MSNIFIIMYQCYLRGSKSRKELLQVINSVRTLVLK
jgi:hypothetical protein